MSEFDFTNEFGAAEAVDTEVPAVDETEKQLYTLNDGSQGSRAAFIREKFLQDNLSRKEISETYSFPYRVVYSATVNLTNEAEAPSRGRTASNATIQVTAEGKLVMVDAEGKIFVNGEEVAEKPETEDKSRNEWIKESVDAGISRGDIANWLDLSYGVIYNLTKDADGVRSKHMVDLEDGTQMPRSEYIRARFAAGISRSDIAAELQVPYTVVWQATKVEKDDQARFNEAVEGLKVFADKVEDKALFDSVMVSLTGMTIKAEAEDDAE